MRIARDKRRKGGYSSPGDKAVVISTKTALPNVRVADQLAEASHSACEAPI